MKLDHARKLAVQLMQEHGLLDRGWTFQFDRAKRRFGNCNARKRRITMSRALTSVNDEATARNVILHEIAHALDWHLNGEWGHGPTWREVAKSIGCTAERCTPTVTRPDPKYRAVCDDCGEEHVLYRLVKDCSHHCTCHGKTFNPQAPKLVWEQLR